MTLENETERADLIARPTIYERYRESAVYSRAVIAHSHFERDGLAIHVLPRPADEAQGVPS